VKKRYAVAFTGPSNSGKTTVIEKIAKKMVSEYQMAIVKNDPKDKAHFDIEGKDSYRFFQTGAEVVVTSPCRTTFFSHREKELDEIVTLLGDFDYLLVEGLKTLPLPRIAIFRNRIEEDYYPYSEAIAIDESINPKEYAIPETLTLLDLNNTEEIISWIKHHAKEL